MRRAISLFFVIFAVLPQQWASASGPSCSVADSDKVDCGYVGVTQSECEAKSCCWSPAGTDSQTPWCFSSLYTGYTLKGGLMTQTSTGMTGELELLGSGTQTFGPDIKSLRVDVLYESVDTFRIKITDKTTTRWEVPQSVLPRRLSGQALKPNDLNYALSYTASPFTFVVKRKSDGAILFNLDKPFVAKDQYLEIGTSFSSSFKTFGIGESTRLEQALQPGSTYTLWAADVPAAAFYKNLYGSFPYYLQLDPSGVAHGAMLLSSNGMDVLLKSDSLTFKVLGGIIDLYVFSGPTPDSVVSQYTSVVGNPMMMPYWSLGFHNCKYGYKSIWEIEDVVTGYRNAGIPLETQWADIDYMQDYRDFTTSSTNFPVAEVKSFVDKLHAQGQHFVPIVDPGIMVFSGYDAYETGVKEGVFLRDVSGGFYLGQVWPGPTYFPDFLNPKTQDYWTTQIQKFHDAVPVDGLWIDMNEISNFCNDGGGQVCKGKAGCPTGDIKTQTMCCLECSTTDSTNPLDFPPYRIHNQQGNGALSYHTVAMSSYAFGNISSYNAHNLYGLTEQIATKAALTSVRNKRPFLLTRSSFPSTGKHSAKWTGDNAATWKDLQSSIISVMDFNLFGVPAVGADICGFLGDTNEELCARWISTGAFYPFSRDHSALDTANQELYLWPSVTQAAKNALGMRYQMLPYLYTQFYKANTQGTAVARALWLNYPKDPATHSITAQFMLGQSVLISPCIEQGAMSVKAYFPQNLWYDFSQRKLAIDASSGGLWKTLDTPLTATNVHVSGGSILPLQQAELTVAASRASPFTFLVALCEEGQAQGRLFFDDGEQVELKNFFLAQYNVATSGGGVQGSLSSTLQSNSYSAAASAHVDVITVMSRGLTAAPSAATLNGKALAANQIVFDKERGSFSFVALGLPLNAPLALEWK